jgi:uncharacterized protein YegP (UPF0339 family)
MKKPPSKTTLTFDVYRTADGEWRWRLWAKNGNVVADSGEGYKRRGDCMRMVNRLIDNALGAAVFVEGVLQ